MIMHRIALAILLILCISPGTQARVWEIHCFHGLSIPIFEPSSLHMNAGDTIHFLLDPACSVIEVSAASYYAGIAQWNGGFQTPVGGGMVVPTMPPGNTHATLYFAIPQHLPISGMGMGTIEIYVPTINITTLQPLTSCVGDSVSIGFTAFGVYSVGNLFELQMSDATGSFSSPTQLAIVPGDTYYKPGQLPSPTGGTIYDTVRVPLRLTIPPGTGYRVRAVSAMHGVVGIPSSQALTILARPAPILQALGPTEFCEGGSVTLAVTPTTGHSYAWYHDGTPIAGASQAQYTATLHGEYTVEESNGSCAVMSAPVAVTVHAADPSWLEWTGAVNADWSTVGNWSEPCAVPGTGDTVIVGAAVAPPAFVPAAQLGALVLDHPAGLILQGELRISSRLALNNGHLFLGNADLILLSSATISGGGASGFVVTDGAGRLHQQGLGSGGRGGAVLFPVGSAAGSYSPVTITNAGTTDAFSVRVANDVFEQGATGTPVFDRVVAKTWFIDEAVAGGSSATLSFEWNSMDELYAFDRAACFVAHHDGTAWDKLQNPGTATGGGPWQRGVAGVTSFALFAVGSTGSYIPVEYRSLSAAVQDGIVFLRWETASETYCRGFTVERRQVVERRQADDAAWTALDFIESTSAAGRGASYLHPDMPPSPGTWEYRLRQIDLDGTETLSRAVRAEIPESALPYYTTVAAIDEVWPNPLRLAQSTVLSVRCKLATDGPVSLTLHDLLGRRLAELYRGAGDPGTDFTLRLSFDRTRFSGPLTPGVYVLRLATAAGVSQRVLVID
jgi:hypothetical protein